MVPSTRRLCLRRARGDLLRATCHSQTEDFMEEEPRRLPPRLAVRQRLFALSRNQCAFPGCQASLVDHQGVFVGQLCHIEAALPGGERFNPHQSNEQRRAFENLVLLCYPHHCVTNDVSVYKPDLLRVMKQNHEQAVFSPTLDGALTDRFLDQSSRNEFAMPRNLGQLDLGGLEQDFFDHAPVLLTRIAEQPQMTRSLYAHAFLRAIAGDLFMCFALSELDIALQAPTGALDAHIGILIRAGLFTEGDPDNDWRQLPIRGPRFFFCGLDRVDNGIYLLFLIYRRFRNEAESILDLFENLNFSLLER